MTPLAAEPHDHGRILVNPAYRDLLAGAGLLSFDAVMRFDGGETLRTLARRANLRLRLTDTDGKPVRLYMKRHRPPSVGELVRRWAAGLPPTPPGRREWDAAALLAAAGIPTAERVAVGQERTGFRPGASFFISAELVDYRPADEVLGSLSAEERRPLLDGIARLVRRFHAAGLRHRDLYLCHIFVRRSAPGRFDLALIDLQRVDRLRRRRWLVKDIAQLAYSARGILGAEEWNRWLCRYLDVERLGRGQRRFAAAVGRKADRIARHDRRRGRGTSPAD